MPDRNEKNDGTNNSTVFNITTLIISLVALFISLHIHHENSGVSKRREAIALCDKYFLSEELDKRFTIIQGRQNKIEKDSLPNELSRAYGDVFNFMNLVAIAQLEGLYDVNILRRCLGEDLKMFCDSSLLKKFDSSWQYLEEMLMDEQFWHSEPNDANADKWSESKDKCRKEIREVRKDRKDKET